MLSLTRACSSRHLVAAPSQAQLSPGAHLQVNGSQRSLAHVPGNISSQHHYLDAASQQSPASLSPSTRCIDACTQTPDSHFGNFGTHKESIYYHSGLNASRPTRGVSNAASHVPASFVDIHHDQETISDAHPNDMPNVVEYDDTQLQRNVAPKRLVRQSTAFGSFFVADSPVAPARHAHGPAEHASPCDGNVSVVWQKRERPSAFSAAFHHESVANGTDCTHHDLSPVDEKDSEPVSASRRTPTANQNGNNGSLHRISTELDGHGVSEDDEDNRQFDHSTERDYELHLSTATGRYRKHRLPSTSSNQHARIGTRDYHTVNSYDAQSAMQERNSVYSHQLSHGVSEPGDEYVAEGACEQQGTDTKLYLPKVVRLLISSFSTYLMLAVFVFLWAFIIKEIESTTVPKDTSKNDDAKKLLYDFLSQTVLCNESLHNWHSSLETGLNNYSAAIIETYKVGVNGDDKDEWSLLHSLIFVETVVTTIGYGHLSPKTWWGQVLTMICALSGVPLFCLTVNELGSLLAHVAKLVVVLMRTDCATEGLSRGRTVRTTTVEIKLWMIIVLLPACLALLGAISYALYIDTGNPHSFFTSFYWMFVTLSTIGFGDVVPKNDLAFLLMSLPVLAGCGLFAMVINRIMLKYVDFGCTFKRYVVKFIVALRKSHQHRRVRKQLKEHRSLLQIHKPSQELNDVNLSPQSSASRIGSVHAHDRPSIPFTSTKMATDPETSSNGFGRDSSGSVKPLIIVQSAT